MTNAMLQPCNEGDRAHEACIICSSPVAGNNDGGLSLLYDSVRAFNFAPTDCSAVTAYSLAERLEQAMSSSELRRANIIALGDHGAYAQALAITSPKKVRRLILIDPSCRVAPTTQMTLLDRIESLLPLGLPLRMNSDEFDSRSFLHRIRCPTLVVMSRAASQYQRSQAQLMAERIPNAWNTTISTNPLNNGMLTDELSHLVKDFLQVPVKRPQKNLGPKSAKS